MPRTKKTTVTKAKRTTTPRKTTKKKTTTRAKKSAVDKINSAVSKWDASSVCPDHIKLGTSDFLDFLAANLEKGVGMNYDSTVGTLSVLPKKPKELLSTVKYLRKQSMLGKTKKV